MKALITGGAGFVGSHLAEALLAQGHEVHVIDNLSTGSIENIEHLKGHERFHYTIDSIMNEPLLAELVDRVDVVFHLAAAVGDLLGAGGRRIGGLRVFGVFLHGRRNLFHRGGGLLQARRLLLGALRQIRGAGGDLGRGVGHLEPIRQPRHPESGKIPAGRRHAWP